MVSFFLSSGWSEMMVVEENIIRLSVFLSVIHHILNRMNNIGIVLYFFADDHLIRSANGGIRQNEWRTFYGAVGILVVGLRIFC